MNVLCTAYLAHIVVARVGVHLARANLLTIG
jgi:hypothetical protein